MSAVAVVAVGEKAVRFAIPGETPRAALLAWLLERPDVVDASLAAEHALVVFADAPAPLVLPVFASIPSALPREHVIHVAYDGEDLDEVAALASLGRDEVIARHTARPLEVAFLGFCPGFAYLVGLDPALAAIPRHGAPRPRVPPNAVALAGGFSGIYPAATPGGWRLLGRAPDAHLLDGESPRFGVGDRVRFVAR